jgi:hypothetical protein
VHKLGRFPIE